MKKAAPAEGAPILIAPFSRLGSASEWSREQWTELVSLLPGRTVLVALEHLNVELAVGAPEALFSVMDGASVAVAVDGDFPSLCSFRGLPVVTLFSTRLPDVYRPMGTFNRSLYSHQCCSPCFRKDCDRDVPCNRHIAVREVLDALREISGKE